MRLVPEHNFYFDDDDYFSVFIGQCESYDRVMEYVALDYNLMLQDYIASEMGIEFNINSYDEDFYAVEYFDEPTDDAAVLVKEAGVEVVREIVEKYSKKFDTPYNVLIIIGHMKYEGEVTEVDNEDYGRYKFLGYFPEK